VIGAPFLVLGVLVTLSALIGARVTRRPRGSVLDVLFSPLHPATWAALAAILVGVWVELLAFAAVVALLSAGASMLVVGVGFVLVGLAIEAARLTSRVERARTAWADPRPLLAHAYRPYGQGLRDLAVAIFLDPARWRDVLYVIVAFPLAVLEFAVATTLWSIAVVLLSIPLWALAGVPIDAVGDLPLPDLTSAGAIGVLTLAGIGMTIAAAVVSRGLMVLHRAVVIGLLCEPDQRALARRVATLETSRRAVLDVEASELRRIERDLHDGVQQRLVRLSLDLGVAAERIDEDPAAAKVLVEEARDQARLALAELRDLVRGISPAILLDRGLVPALSALAGRGAVPVVVASELPDGLRLPDVVERAAYFVVAESVANLAKHARATRAEIRCRYQGGRLVVEIEDDGVGGARVAPGGGLGGLADRLAALDGALEVSSPEGGPTVVRATIPTDADVAPVGWPAAAVQDPR
jgi:signal transduction histidine kinase